jgi:hypothetical protein
MALVIYPLRFGNPTWEFGVVDLAFSSLPVVTIGLAAMLVSAIALRRTTLVRILAIVALFAGLACVMGYSIFLLDVPLALRNSPAEAQIGIKKAIFRNSVFGVCFATAYLSAGVASLRHLRAVKRDGSYA